MRRRQVLACSAALGIGGLAGCLTSTGTDGTTDTDETTAADDATTAGETTTTDGTTSDDGATTTDDESTATDGTTGGGTTTGDGATPDVGANVGDHSFEALDGGCGEGVDEARASFGDGSVTVTGTISGTDGCRRPRLAGASYDADELVVAVETHADGEMCSECLVDLDYEATFRFEGAAPGSVVVRHDSRGETRTVLEAAD